MYAWTGRLVILGALLFLAGWALVLVSGHGGESSGGSEMVWRIGGLMVYASMPVFLAAALHELAARIRSRRRVRAEARIRSS